jgi:membrane fusion protein (multidrug efflux system)
MRPTAVTFSRTMRSLDSDRLGSAAWTVALLAVILGLWAGWLTFGRVAIYAVSESARIETSSPPVAVQSIYAGRITRNDLVLGRKVRRGDVLAALDANLQQLQLAEEQSQGASIGAQLVQLQQQIAAEKNAIEEDERAVIIGLEEAGARLREASAAAAYAKVEVDRLSTLDREGLLPHSEVAQARSQEERNRATVDGMRLAIKRQEQELLVHKAERQSKVIELQRQLDQLSGSKTKLRATLDRLKTEVGLREVVAPADGTIGEVADLPLGSVVTAGQRLGVIVSDQRLKIVAQFDPSKAVGRVRGGQEARLRLTGFPWTQYGTVTATVTRVGEEVQNGYVRVELTPGEERRIALQHGQPGAVEIIVERAAPASILLRLAGQPLAPAVPQRVAPAQAGTQ